MTEFDYVIVGAGSAGSVIARRLIDAGSSVCVLEAGPPDRNPFIHMPAGFMKTLFDPGVTFQFTTEPSDGTAGRRLNMPQGRVLGGSSSVNGMVFIRGQAADYDAWAQRGNRGWSYSDLLPYFRRSEQRVAEHDPAFRGSSGPIPVTDPDWRHPLCEAFIASARSIGFPLNHDYNSASQAGTGYYQRVIRGARRVSAARAYLHPVRRSPRLRLITNAAVSAIVLDGRRAVGVRYSTAGRSQEARAAREVILCAGAINTPRLLELSGIGKPNVLAGIGVGVSHALPGVGENLSGHFAARLVARVKNTTTINEEVRGVRLVSQLMRWAAKRPSVMGNSAAICYAMGSSDPALDAPDFTINFAPASFRGGVLGALDTFAGMTVGAWQMRPESLGSTHVTSADPSTQPTIQPNYLSAEKDRMVLLAALRMARQIFAGRPLAPYYDHETLPGPLVQTDDEWIDFMRRFGTTCYHPAGTCRMGPEPRTGDVVDDQLRVHGLAGLRVADNSIMPSVVSANTYATALMIGERAADLIQGI